MSSFSKLLKKKDKTPVPTPQMAANADSAATSVPNSANLAMARAQTPNAPQRSFWQKAKDNVSDAASWVGRKAKGAASWVGGRAVDVFDAVRNTQDDFHDWRKGVKKKIQKAYAGSALQKGVNAVKEAGRSVWNGTKKVGSWFKDKAADAAQYIKDSRFAKAMGSAVDTIKTKAGEAGRWVRDKASSAAQYIRDSRFGKAVGSAVDTVKTKAGEMGQWVRDKAYEVKDGFVNSKLGKTLINSGRFLKDKAVNIANHVGEKAGKIKGWINDKKDRLNNWFEDKAQAIREHDEERYLQHRVNKLGAGHFAGLINADAEMGEGEISENMRMRADVDRLGRYDDESRDYMTAEEAEQAATENQAAHTAANGKLTDEAKEGYESVVDGYKSIRDEESSLLENINSGRKITKSGLRPGDAEEVEELSLENLGKKGKTANKYLKHIDNALAIRNTIGEMKDTADTIRSGNYEEAAISGMGTAGDAADTAMSIANFESPAASIFKGGYDMLKGASAAGIHINQKKRVNAIEQDSLLNGAESNRDKKMMLGAQKSMSAQLSRQTVDDVADSVKGGLKFAGGIADVSGAGGLGSAVSSLASIPVDIAKKMITRRMRDKDNKRIMKADLFGGTEEYDRIKHTHGLSKREMQILAKRRTKSRTIDDIADRARLEQAQTVHRTLGKENSGGHSLMKARGYTTHAGRQGLSSDNIAEMLGRERDLESLKRRTLPA